MDVNNNRNMKTPGEDETIQNEMMKSADEARRHQMRNVGRVSSPFSDDEWDLLDGLLQKAEMMAEPKIYQPGQVPMTLLLRVSDMHLMQINMETIMNYCDQDIDKARQIGKLVCVACNADAQVLVFEGEMKGRQAPEPSSGLRPEILFAVSRTWNSPRERALVYGRGPDGLQVSYAPNWSDYDESGARNFAYLLPDKRPTDLEQDAAADSLRKLGIEIETLRDKKRKLDEKRARGQGMGL